ncbi:MAG TPA: glycosyltransferase family 4 protein [Acidimicrobiales bacterium]|nr:glycosyltransferase family 4 protein [Acidimicrobiales bacterium]
MRLMFVVQRYGREIAGGSEQCCRLYAEHCAARGHHVEVATSCAKTYTDWKNEFPPGAETINGVFVNRFPVDRERSDDTFARINDAVAWRDTPTPLSLQHRWIEEMGPRTLDLPGYLQTRAADIDVFVFFTYLYYPTVKGLLALRGLAPSVFHPTAHVEPYLWVPLFEEVFRVPDTLAFLTPEEGDLVRTRFGIDPMSDVLGVGVDLDVYGNGDRFRREYGIGEDPYLLYVGRIDAGKGSLEMFEYFRAYKNRRPGRLKLVIVGDPVLTLPANDSVIVTGYLSEEAKLDAIAGCTAFLQPSYYESFSMALTEAWSQRRPALVQGRCDVLVGQATRSQGGLPYVGYAQFEATVDEVLGNPKLAETLGNNGRDYVERMYHWDAIMDRYDVLLERTTKEHAQRSSSDSSTRP